jgi:hypothetical protein
MPDASTSSIVQLPSLTRSDLETLFNVAHCMIVSGVWMSADRARNQFLDCVEVTTCDVSGPAISIGVLTSGRYFYLEHRSSAGASGQISRRYSRVGRSYHRQEYIGVTLAESASSGRISSQYRIR